MAAPILAAYRREQVVGTRGVSTCSPQVRSCRRPPSRSVARDRDARHAHDGSRLPARRSWSWVSGAGVVTLSLLPGGVLVLFRLRFALECALSPGSSVRRTHDEEPFPTSIVAAGFCHFHFSPEGCVCCSGSPQAFGHVAGRSGSLRNPRKVPLSTRGRSPSGSCRSPSSTTRRTATTRWRASGPYPTQVGWSGPDASTAPGRLRAVRGRSRGAIPVPGQVASLRVRHPAEISSACPASSVHGPERAKYSTPGPHSLLVDPCTGRSAAPTERGRSGCPAGLCESSSVRKQL